MFSASSLAPPWLGPHRQAMPAAIQANGLAPDATGQTHRGGRSVLLVVGVQDENPVHSPGQDRVGLVVLRRDAERHLQEVFRVAQFIARRHERLADRVFERARRDSRHLGDQPMGRNLALFGVIDIDAIVIEGRQSPDRAGHDGHRVGVTAEPAKEPVELRMQHRVIGDDLLELGEFFRVRQFAVWQKKRSRPRESLIFRPILRSNSRGAVECRRRRQYR